MTPPRPPGLLVGIDAHNAEREGEGNATYTRNLISALYESDGDDDFALFAARPDHPFYRRLPPRRRSRAVGVAQGLGAVRVGLALGRAATRARVDGLHVQYAAPLGYRGPLVVTVHDLGFLHVPASFPAWLRVALRVLVPRSLARAARIITISEFTRRDIVARYGVAAEKVAVIPLGADPRFHRRDSREVERVLARYGLRPGFVFSLGRLNQRKNLGRLLEAHGRLGSAGRSPTPLVIGGKPDHGGRDVRRRTRASEEAVRFVGLIPDEDLPAFYSAASCFVYPSLFEGFGLPLLEAMACGTPVVASNRTAMPALVGDAGLLVDPESVQELTAAMARVLRDADLAQDLGRRGVLRSRRYSWADTARQTLAVYRDAFGASASSRSG